MESRHIYIYICVCVCVYIYIYTHTHICIYIHTYTHTYIHTYRKSGISDLQRGRIYMHVSFIWLYVCTFVWAYACVMHKQACVCVCVCLHFVLYVKTLSRMCSFKIKQTFTVRKNIHTIHTKLCIRMYKFIHNQTRA